MPESSQFPDYKKAKVADLVPYARNSRTHSAEQVDKIAASIREFGFLNPVITDGHDGIVAGHGRILAAQKLGMNEVPTIDAGHLSETQRRAYIIADNRLALDAGWDDEMLRVEFAELDADGFDIELTGFTLDEIDALEGGGGHESEGPDADFGGHDGVFEVVVECQDESEQESIYRMMTAKGLKCRVLSM